MRKWLRSLQTSMSTEKQIEANRLNAQKSTGPKTPEGKAKVSMNSLRHGLRARATVLQNENPEEFQQLCDGLEAEWQPQSPTESALLEKMAIAQWKLARAERRETGVRDRYREENQEIALELLAKFQERFERSFYRALRELQKLQKSRRQAASPPVEEAPAKEAPTIRLPDPPSPPVPARTPNIACTMSAPPAPAPAPVSP